jgi:hypothetical protein
MGMQHAGDDKFVQNYIRNISKETEVSRWENYIKMDDREVGCEDVGRFHMAQDREQWQAHVTTLINLGFHRRRGDSRLPE